MQEQRMLDMRSKEVRLAKDGCTYTKEQFQLWFPDDGDRQWDMAKAVPTVATPPDGLKIGCISKDIVEQVLVEILRHFPNQEERVAERGRHALEIGWTFDHEAYQKSGKVAAMKAKSLSEFPAVCSLLSQAMTMLKSNGDILRSCLNVSCLLYSVGDGIAMHCDRPYCYEDDVYGCVLLNNSDRALEFYNLSKNSEILQRYVVPERPGACFLQNGQARFVWKHGVLPLSCGERISVTWRWFQPDIINSGQLELQQRIQPRKRAAPEEDKADAMCRQVDGARRIAEDGHTYTFEAIDLWNPQWSCWIWRSLEPVPLANKAPSGLVVAYVPKNLVNDALEEVRPHLLRDTWNPGLQVAEIGWSYYKGNYKEDAGDEWVPVTVQGLALSDFPGLKALMQTATQQLHDENHKPRLQECRLNVICRLYSVGQGIAMHSDKKDWFEEDVYGCILQNTSDRSLEFQESDKDSNSVISCHILEECPGMCFWQSGCARYSWRHGIAPLASGERISVTWRWFQSHVECNMNSGGTGVQS